MKVTLTDPVIEAKQKQVNRNNDDLLAKITENKRDEIKIGAKVFLNTNSVDHLTAAIENLLTTLNVTYLDNLILAYHPTHEQINGHTNGNGTAEHGDTVQPNGDSAGKEGILEWGIGNQNALTDLKRLWNVLEQYAQKEKICQLGIADLDTDSLTELYETSVVKPTIAQINLSACCVVPPSLQEFCNKNEIQLLTHSDPEGKLIHLVFFFIINYITKLPIDMN